MSAPPVIYLVVKDRMPFDAVNSATPVEAFDNIDAARSYRDWLKSRRKKDDYTSYEVRTMAVLSSLRSDW